MILTERRSAEEGGSNGFIAKRRSGSQARDDKDCRVELSRLVPREESMQVCIASGNQAVLYSRHG
jgi:hypothetical protein